MQTQSDNLVRSVSACRDDETYNGSNLAVKCLSNSGAYVNLYPFTLSARDLILAAQSAT
jgi:hypothetical protein